MSRLALFVVIAALAAAGGCASGGEPSPVAFDARLEPCSFCRMTGSNGRTAAQLAAPGAQALFFDDIGCLRDYLARSGAPAEPRAALFVADYQSGEWIRAERAVYTRSTSVNTPMNSHLIAHASDAAREANEAGRGGVRLTFAEVFNPGRAK